MSDLHANVFFWAWLFLLLTRLFEGHGQRNTMRSLRSTIDTLESTVQIQNASLDVSRSMSDFNSAVSDVLRESIEGAMLPHAPICYVRDGYDALCETPLFLDTAISGYESSEQVPA